MSGREPETGLEPGSATAAPRANTRNIRLVGEREPQKPARRELLRDVVCLQALLLATDCRRVGDDAEKLLAESIATIAANIFRACEDAERGEHPPFAMYGGGQLAALARSRLAVLEEASQANEERRSFLVEQVGWLDTLANEVVGRLVTALREAG